MYNRVGENCTGTECGQFISNMIASHGGGGTATSLMENPQNRVNPGPGGSLPDGTGAFFPSRNGNPNGQHFVLTYTDQNGVVRALEDTQAGAGGGGQRRVRADRTLAQIQAEHGTQPIFFHVPGGSIPSTPPLTTLPGGAQQYRSPQGADPFAVPGSPIAQFEQQHGGLMARTVQNGMTRAVAKSGAVQWFDGRGRPIPPPQAPLSTPSYGQQFAQAANDVYGEEGSAYKPSGPGLLPKIPADLAIAARGVGQVPETLYNLEEKGSAAVGKATAQAVAKTAAQNGVPGYQATRAYGAGAHQASEAFDADAAANVAGLAPYGSGPALLQAAKLAAAGNTSGASAIMSKLPAGVWSFVKQHPVLAVLDTANIAGLAHAGFEGVRGLRAGEPIPEMDGTVMEAAESGKPTTLSVGKRLGNPTMVSGEGLYTGPKLIGGELRLPQAQEIAEAFEPKGTAVQQEPQEPVLTEKPQVAPHPVTANTTLTRAPKSQADLEADYNSGKNVYQWRTGNSDPLYAEGQPVQIPEAPNHRFAVIQTGGNSPQPFSVVELSSGAELGSGATPAGAISATQANAARLGENFPSLIKKIISRGDSALNQVHTSSPLVESEPKPGNAPVTQPVPIVASVEAPKPADTPGAVSAAEPLPTALPPTIPATEGAPAASETAATPKKPASEYAGSINIGKLSNDQLKDAYTQRATALGLDNQEPLTRQQMRDQGRALGLTQEALVRLPVGWKPNNVHFGAWLSAVRDADDLAHVAEANAKRAVKADPTPENQAALAAAKTTADATFQRRSAISREWGQSGQVLKTPSDPFAAAKEGDLFRQEPAPVVKAGRMKRIPAEERVKAETFGKANTRYTAADTDAAMARIDARFRAARSEADLSDCVS